MVLDMVALREIAALRNCSVLLATVFCNSVRKMASVPLTAASVAAAVRELAQKGPYTVEDVVREAWLLDGWPAAKLDERLLVLQAAAKAKKPVAEPRPARKGKSKPIQTLEVIMNLLGTDDVAEARQFCLDVQKLTQRSPSHQTIAKALYTLSANGSYTLQEVATLASSYHRQAPVGISMPNLPPTKDRKASRRAKKRKAAEQIHDANLFRPTPVKISKSKPKNQRDVADQILYGSAAPKLAAAKKKRSEGKKRYMIHPDGTVTGLPGGADGGDGSTNPEAGDHGADDAEGHDGSKYWGYMSRENGQFGSFPLFDDYGDESEP